MGKNFKAARPEIVEDILFQPPWEMMQQALATKQAGFDAVAGMPETLLDKLKIDYDPALDSAEAAKLRAQFEQKGAALVDEVYKDPMNYNKSLGKIRSLSREIQEGMLTGDIAKLAQRKADREEYQKMLNTFAGKEGYEPELVRRLSMIADASSQRDPGAQLGPYRKDIVPTKLDSQMDIIKKYMEGAVPTNTVSAWDIETFEKIQRGESVTKGFSPAFLDNVIYFMQQDPEIRAGLEQRAMVGLPGYEAERNFNPDGSYKLSTATKDKNGNLVGEGQNYFSNMRLMLHNLKGNIETKTTNYQPLSKEAELIGKQSFERRAGIFNGVVFEERGFLKTLTGKNADEFYQRSSKVNNSLINSRALLEQMFFDQYQVKNETELSGNIKALSELEALRSGDASSLKTDDMVTKEKLATEYKSALMQRAALTAAATAFRQKTGKYPQDDKDAFNFYLQEELGTQAETTFKHTWSGLGMTTKDVAAVIKQIADSQQYLDGEITFQPGTIITYKDVDGVSKEIDLGAEGANKHTLNELLKKGFIRRKQQAIKTEIATASQGVSAEERQAQREAGTYNAKDVYVMVGTEKLIDFSFAPETVIPTVGDAEGDISLAMKIQVAGVYTQVSLPQVKVNAIEQFKAVNAKTIAAQNYFNAIANLDKVDLPSADAAYYPKGTIIEGKVVGPRNVVVKTRDGKNHIFNVDNPVDLERLGEIFF